jgi:hypothetical protein
MPALLSALFCYCSDGFLQNLLSIDRVGRELQLNVPKSVIE